MQDNELVPIYKHFPENSKPIGAEYSFKTREFVWGFKDGHTEPLTIYDKDTNDEVDAALKHLKFVVEEMLSGEFHVAVDRLD